MKYVVCLFVCLQQVVFSLIATGACGGLRCRQRRIERVDRLVGSARGYGSEDDEDDKPPELEEDVRDFRARLISRSKSGDLESSASLKNKEVTSVKTKGARAEEEEEEEEGKKIRSSSVTKDEKSGEEKWAYETPLLEQGSVLLGGTEQEIGFTLRQQYFHKCVVVVTQHDEHFTKGVIVNRPSRRNLEGWEVWLGGDVCEGGIFAAPSAGQKREGQILPGLDVECLTAEAELAKNNPDCIKVVKGIWRLSFESAKQMVADGIAQPENFWLLAGYAGWAPGQLQGELEIGSWYLAAADGGSLVEELLRTRQALQAPSSSSSSIDGHSHHKKKLDDGIATWTSLMERIGHGEEARQTKDNLDDQMLRLWVDTRLEEPSLDAHAFSLHAEERKRSEKAINLLSAQPPEITARQEIPEIARGSLLAGQAVGADFILDQQYLHRSISIVIASTSDFVVSLTLNRPASHKTVALEIGNDRDRVERTVTYGGDLAASGAPVGIVWLTLNDNNEDKLLGGEELPGPFSMSTANIRKALLCAPRDFARAISTGRRDIDEVLAISGITVWQRDDFARLLGTGALVPLDNAEFAWDDLFSLHADPKDHNDYGFGVWAEAIAAAKFIQQDPSHPAAHALSDWHALLRKSTRGPKDAALASTSLADRAFVLFAKFFLDGE